MPAPGPMELVIILVVVMLVFGVGKLPEVGAGLGRGIREFRQSLSGPEEDDQEPEQHQLKGQRLFHPVTEQGSSCCPFFVSATGGWPTRRRAARVPARRSSRVSLLAGCLRCPPRLEAGANRG